MKFKDPKINANTMRVDLASAVADRLLAGETGIKLKKEKAAPGWLIEAVMAELKEDGLMGGRIEPKTYKSKHRTLDRDRIAKRLNAPRFDYQDCRQITEDWPRPVA